MDNDLTALDERSSALREQSSQNLQNFLRSEIGIAFMFASLAKSYLEAGDFGHYEACKQNALAALDAIDHFKDRLPPHISREFATECLVLAALIPQFVSRARANLL